MLSAFLDSELSEADMGLVREAMIDDESLADRLAELACVDEAVRLAAACIDDKPLIPALEALIAASAETPVAKEPRAKQGDVDNVVSINAKRKTASEDKARRFWQQPWAVAASVAAIAGLSWQLLQTPVDRDWQATAQALDTAVSGQVFETDQGLQIKPVMSFADQQNRLCRYYLQQNLSGAASEAVACKHDGSWVQEREAKSSPWTEYQTASGSRQADQWLDELINGSPLTATQEQSAINNQWQPQQTN